MRPRVKDRDIRQLSRQTMLALVSPLSERVRRLHPSVAPDQVVHPHLMGLWSILLDRLTDLALELS
ncbi:MAG: hypothetical protein WB801_01885 [Candidatus Dormiibacterota bacterium]